MKKMSLFVMSVSLCLSSQAFSTDYVRKNASMPDAQADVEALNMALNKMRALGCEDPTSWYYQGAIHAVPDEVKDNKLCPNYASFKTDLQIAWNNCTHPQPQMGSDTGSLHFLLWHRMYIAYFEKIVRKLSGKSDFALPYWDYIDPNYRVMPALLRDKNSSLYEVARLPALNDGYAVGKAPNEDAEQRKKVDQALDINDLMQTKVFSVFSNNINSAPHGFMHDYIGGGFDNYSVFNSIYQETKVGGLMSWVPSAGFDPVFWMHHSEIDRIWASWNHSSYGEKAPEKALVDHPWPYVFFDGNGKEHQYTVAEAYKAAYSMDYRYDNLISVSSPTGQSKTMLASSEVKPYSLAKKSPVWTKNLSVETDKSQLTIKPAFLNKMNSKRLLTDAKSSAVVLQVDVSFKSEPNDFYVVYIKKADGSLDKAGVMTFFGSAGHHSMGSNKMNMNLQSSFMYDVTDELADNEDYEIVIESGKDRAITVKVDKISLYKYE